MVKGHEHEMCGLEMGLGLGLGLGLGVGVGVGMGLGLGRGLWTAGLRYNASRGYRALEL